MIKDHPLKGEVVAVEIQRIENQFTINEIIAWLNITLSTIPADEDQKIKDLLNSYKKVLQDMLGKSQTLQYTVTSEAYKLLDMQWSYE